MRAHEPRTAAGSSGNARSQTQTRPPFKVSFHGKRQHNTGTRARKKAVAENPRVLCESEHEFDATASGLAGDAEDAEAAPSTLFVVAKGQIPPEMDVELRRGFNEAEL